MTEDISKVVWPGWETVRLIGNGSFGAVYEIQRSVFGEIETAALKVISIPQNAGDIEEMYSDGYDDESLTNTFHDHLKSIVAEYSMMKKMSDCVNVVKCEDVRYIQHDDKIGWDIFIKMELLTPLVRALPDKIPEKTVIHLAKDICNALITCSKHNIVHRDIKPQNIFISARGDYKLGDFGIAKTVEKTMGGTKIGTYRYMSPEVYNNQPYGSGADIYSLGLVLYWLLNERRLPFLPLPPAKLKAGMDEEARQRRLSGKELLPLPAHGSEALKNIVMKACAYDPANRYRSAGEMLEDIERCIEESDNSSSGNHSSTEDDLTASVLQARCLDTSTQASNKENININLPEIPAIEQADGTVSVFEDPKQNSESIDPSKNRKSHKTIYAIAGILCIVLALGIVFASKLFGVSSETPTVLESQALPAETKIETDQVLSIEDHTYLGVYFISFSMQKGPFDDWRTREAFSLVVDPTYIVNEFAKAVLCAENVYVPITVSDSADNYFSDPYNSLYNYYDPYSENYEANCAKARELLAEAGYPNGEAFPTIEYLYPVGDNHKAVAETLQHIWQTELGVTVTLKSVSLDTYWDNLKKGNYTITSNLWIDMDCTPSTTSFIEGWSESGNESRYTNLNFDEEIPEYRKVGQCELLMYKHAGGVVLGDKAIGFSPLYFVMRS